ncbi:MAG: efflux RND transporter permease subunit, partial [Agathobaculum sp.]|uniref:efflux RND transporter permease subunit n=1 Tax=Agathobaculum sp. TaxID=2048138 RepID=UPI003D90DEC3
MNLKGHSPVDLIINNRKRIERVFTILVIICLIFAPMVGVNYDLTKYLPDSTDSAQAIDILEQEFTYPGMGRVMLQDVTLYEAKTIKDRIADVDGVDLIMWCDSTTNIYGSSEFINYSDIDDYYKDGDAYMDITFLESDSSPRTHRAVHEIEQIVGDRGLVAGSAVSDTNLGPTINREVALVMVLAVIFIFAILAVTTTSWFEPVLFLMVMGIAIILNMGSNIIFGEISFMSNAVGAVLQLACSIDYSIFLLHSFSHEKANGIEPEQAMANALRSAVTSIGASGMTTIVGFLALALMRFGIGPDMGFVLSKGIAFSLLTVLLLMPALILRFQGLIEKTQHRSFMPSFRRFGEFAYKIRVPVMAVVLILIVPCYIAQGMADFTFGNEAVSNSPGTPVYEAEQIMNEKFGQSNTMLALVPAGDNLSEKAMSEQIDALPYVKRAMGLASVLPEGIPEDFLPASVTGQ